MAKHITEQMKNGHAFEFAFASELAKWVGARMKVEIIRDSSFAVGESCYFSRTPAARKRFDRAAALPIETISRLEPGILNARSEKDILFIRQCKDDEGKEGDVRDIVLFRKGNRNKVAWEIGISAKNNNDSAKHSRISHSIRFGKTWLGMDTSKEYVAEMQSVDDWLEEQKRQGRTTWDSLGSSKNESAKTKEALVYVPMLEAFKREMERLFREDQKKASQNLIKYLIGRKPFYKLIKNDRDNTSVLKVFNFVSGLGKAYNGVRPDCRPRAIPLPTRCVELAFAEGGMRNTLSLIMDKGWQVNFRIHNAATKIESSLKFDVTLEGNPPVLFTQHLF